MPEKKILVSIATDLFKKELTPFLLETSQICSSHMSASI